MSEPERVTPRIDSTARCRCHAELVFDEVFGWLHVAASQPGPQGSAHMPGPASDVDPVRSS
jgi:hypothetical protein